MNKEFDFDPDDLSAAFDESDPGKSPFDDLDLEDHMNSLDFSKIPDDEDFEEIDEFDEFDEFDEDEFEEVNVRTAVLSKNNMIALLCIKTASEGAAICRVDPRENVPSVQIYDDPEKAVEWFRKSLRTSKLNGWRVVYDGLPLQG